MEREVKSVPTSTASGAGTSDANLAVTSSLSLDLDVLHDNNSHKTLARAQPLDQLNDTNKSTLRHGLEVSDDALASRYAQYGNDSSLASAVQTRTSDSFENTDVGAGGKGSSVSEEQSSTCTATRQRPMWSIYRRLTWPGQRKVSTSLGDNTKQPAEARDSTGQSTGLESIRMAHEAVADRWCPEAKRKTYSCNLCPSVFFQASKLKSHVLVHARGKPYPCPFCSSSFALSSTLQRHVLGHPGAVERLLACEEPEGGGEGAAAASWRSSADESVDNAAGLQLMSADMRRSSREAVTKSSRPGVGKPGKNAGSSRVRASWSECSSQTQVHWPPRDTVSTVFAKKQPRAGTVATPHHLPMNNSSRLVPAAGLSDSRAGQRSASFRSSLNFTWTSQPSAGILYDKPFSCGICNRRFSCRNNLGLHVLTHSTARSHSCGQCGRAFAHRRGLRRHMIVHTEEKPHTCRLCSRSFARASQLYIHTLSHSGIKPHACDECGRRFLHAHSLKHHKTSHTGEKRFMCERCGKRFTLASNLKKHSRLHTGEKPYACQQCGERFTWAVSLKTHEQLHTGEKPHCCDRCPERFVLVSQLKSHKLTHSDKKPHVCSVCQRRFTKSCSLKEHMRTHTGEKPYNCDLCHHRFAHAGNLKVHMLTHSREKPHVCDKCSRGFTQVRYLKKHQLSHAM